MKIVERKISELIPAEYNPRQLSSDQREQISASLKRFGFVDPVIINTHPDRKNIIIGGHMRTRVAKEELGMTEVPCVELSLTLDQERELNIRLNKNSGEWDFELLANHFEVDELTDWGFELGELDMDLGEDEPDIEEDEFDGELPEEPKTELGRIYQLGRHRLMCGDSTSEEDVKRLMGEEKADMVFTDPPYGVSFQSGQRSEKADMVFTDPPYGVSFQSGQRSEKFDVLKNDDVFLDIRPIIDIFLKDNSAAFIWTSHHVYTVWRDMFEDIYKNTIIWYKNAGGMGDLKGNYAVDYEMCLFCVKGEVEFIGKRGCAVWDIRRDANSDYVHPTQKPLTLADKALKDFTVKGDITLDLFGGSGSTLIACEQSKRQCRMMELDPKYCDVIVKRYCKLKDIDPETVFETGVAK